MIRYPQVTTDWAGMAVGRWYAPGNSAEPSHDLPLRLTSGTPCAPLALGRSTPSILLVDDDATLLEAIAAALRLNGFEVSAFNNPRDAEAAFRRSPYFDLLLTDLDLPEYPGTTLAERLVALQPSLPVMIITGSVHLPDGRRSTDGPGWCCLSKPFDPLQLLTTITAMLAPGPRTPRRTVPPPGALPSGIPPPAQPPGTDKSLETSTRPLVLLVGNDSSLLRSRELLLESAGFTALGTSSHVPLDTFDATAFRVALLCRSISHGDALRIAKLLHASNPRLPILRFAFADEPTSGDFVSAIANVSSPPSLIAEVKRLASASL